MRYRNVSGHPEDLADGRIVGVAEFVELNDEQASDSFNKDKLDRGVFAQVVEPENPPDQPGRPELMARAKELNIAQRGSMRNDELLTAILEAEGKVGQEGDES